LSQLALILIKSGERETMKLISRLGGSGGMACRVVVSGAFLASTLFLAACGEDSDSSGGGEDVSLAVFMASTADGYTRNLSDAATEQAEKMGASDVQTFDATFDPQKQLQQCQDAIASQRFQGFIIHAVVGPSMVSCAREAIDAGISVMVVNAPLGPEVDTTEPQVEGLTGTILASPGTMGRTLAELAIEACAGKDPCRVIYEFGPADFSFAADTRKVFNEEVGEEATIDVVAEGSHNFVPDEARSLTRQLLVAHPNVDVITSDDDPTAAAALDVIKELGLDGQISVIGGAGAREGAELVASGEMFGSAVLVPRSVGSRAAEIAILDARGEDPGETELNEAEDLSPVGPKLTQQNADRFTAEWSASD
jgi:ribose transport system substrate-binding protein